MSLRQEIRDPYLPDFLDLKDEYSESDLEEAIVRHLEWFLLEMGAGLTSVARQKRIRERLPWDWPANVEETAAVFPRCRAVADLPALLGRP